LTLTTSCALALGNEGDILPINYARLASTGFGRHAHFGGFFFLSPCVNTPRQAPAKPATTLDEQIALLRRRGMAIADEDQARHHLGHLNYYRLRGYWMGFEQPDGSGEHTFRPGTTFEAVIELYDFDRRLRLEINDAIECFEVSLRTRWAYVLGHRDGPTAYRNPDLFRASHPMLLQRVEALCKDRREPFLRHYLERGEEPPIWALCETMSLGDLSRWLRSLKNHCDRQTIADAYGLHERFFCSFVEHLAHIRNVCAHHARLWNKHLIVATLALPKKPLELVEQLQYDPAQAKRLYNALTLLAWLMRIISPRSTWCERMRALITERPDLWADMGFPLDWRSFDLWREDAR
jgi:abortive infection bacteriophage resistance protein